MAENTETTENDQESTTADVETAETTENQKKVIENTEPADNQQADKIVEKLQKRIGKESAEKNKYKDQLDEAMKRIEKLEKGEDPDKPEPADEKDNRITELEKQLKRRDMTDQARSVLAEGGINVPEAVLDFVVTDDDKTTLSNVKALINYTVSVREAADEKYLKGQTPKRKGGAIKAVTTEELDQMSLSEKMALEANNPELFKKLTGGL